MSILQDLLALKQAIPENQDELEAAHAAQADEFHSGHDDSDMTTTELASADEFAVEHDSDDMVHILDGERSIRVTMPYHIWLELCQETVHRHAMRR
jgi:hypothetical protein